ncbi:MAG: sulfurtransferase [Vulcanimicrobiaceae bacterium]
MTENAFVDRDYLLAHLTDPDVRIVDARSVPHGVAVAQPPGIERYRAGHIAGAVHVDYHDDLRDPATPYAARVAPPDRFAAIVGALGIGDDTTVVAYDDGDAPYAARMVWMLRYYGHDAAFVLAGGLGEWRAHGGTMTAEIPIFEPRTFTPHVRPQLRATRDEVLAVAEGRSDAQLVETQRDKTYGMRDRDIAGAVRLSGSQLLEDACGGRVAPRETLDALVARAGLERGKRTIVSCGSGVSASGSYLALRAAGFTDVAVYDGSWMEWSHDGLPTVAKAER